MGQDDVRLAMKYLIALLLSGCAVISGPCYVITDGTGRYIVCEEGGVIWIVPSKMLEFDKDRVFIRP
jgi:hypothetical protein